MFQAAATPVTDEAELMARAKRDRQAFAPLYAHYLDPIYRYCYRRLDSREAAEDATSQVFLKALGALPSFKGNSVRAWLFTIAHNVVTDAYRRRKPRAQLDDITEPADPALSPEELAIAADDRRSLLTVMEQLAPDQQRVLELRLSGLTGAEIAEVLGRSEAAVKMLQSRAFARLRAAMSVDGDR
jgi:RNA polymerase sigma-70 factor (ECF subfamily)